MWIRWIRIRIRIRNTADGPGSFKLSLEYAEGPSLRS
jgi:hypothetical protein